MKSFLILLSEKQDLRDANLLEAHIHYLKNLRENGNLLISGSFTDNEKAMFIIRANSKYHAEELINDDPFINKNYYQKFEIYEFMETSEESDGLINSDASQDHVMKNNAHHFLNVALNTPETINKPRTMSVLFRKLKDGKSYHDFRKAWLPPVENINQYFHAPTLVINACNIKNPNEIISLALIWEDIQEAIQNYERYQETEALRHQRIEQVTDQSAETRVCQIVDIDVLGQAK